jgi:hypothetical protein
MSEEYEESREEEDEEELLLQRRPGQGGRERENVLLLGSVSGIMPLSLCAPPLSLSTCAPL